MKVWHICVGIFVLLCLLASWAFFSIGRSTSSVKIQGQDVSCVGVLDDKDPQYNYKTHSGNVIWALLGIPGALVPTIYIPLTRLHCPTGLKETANEKSSGG